MTAARATLPDLDALNPHELKAFDCFATRTDRVSRQRDRTAETVDRQVASHALRAFFGEAGSADRASRAAPRSAAAERSGESCGSSGSNCECGSGGPTGTAATASAPAAGSAHLLAEARSLPGLWRKAEASRRRYFGDAGNRARALQSNPPGSPQIGLHML